MKRQQTLSDMITQLRTAFRVEEHAAAAAEAERMKVLRDTARDRLREWSKNNASHAQRHPF